MKRQKGNVEATYLSRRMWLDTDFKGYVNRIYHGYFCHKF